MRLNLPVSQHNYDYPADELLVSSTNLKGEITHCNGAFQRVSGFAMDELLGQPHNIIRHPDMPAAAYKDMWRTIGRGQPWTGLVKNRRKNGDHYWVRANVTPIMQGGKPREYLSVRTKPTAQEIDQAEALYAAMRQATAQGRTHVDIVQGQVYRTGWAGRVQRALGLGVAMRLALWLLALGLVLQLPDLLGWQGPQAWGARAILFVAGSALLMLDFRRFCVKGIEEVAQYALKIAGCDLRTPVPNRYSGSLGQLMHRMQQIQVNLQAVVGDVRAEIQEFVATTDDIARGSHDLAQRVEHQASNLVQTTSAMDAMTHSVQQTYDVAQRMAAHSQRSSAISTQSSQVVQEVDDAMQEMGQASTRMQEITSTIEGIAFQTNLLALNAAVEAARAGEHGRGFAVVASEVRALAQRSRDAAHEIHGLIERTTSGIATGHERAAHASQTMGQVLQVAQEVEQLVHEIGNTTQVQNQGIAQMAEAVTQLDEATQQNAALAEQSSAAAQMLRASVHVLEHSVGVFTV